MVRAGAGEDRQGRHWEGCRSQGAKTSLPWRPRRTTSRGMMAYTLRFQNELRNQSDYFRDIKPPPIDATLSSSPRH